MSLIANYDAPDYQWRTGGTGTMVHIFYKNSKLQEKSKYTEGKKRTEQGRRGQAIDIDATYLKDFFEEKNGQGHRTYFPAGATVTCKQLGTFDQMATILKEMDKPEEGEAPKGFIKYEKFDCFFFIFLTFSDTNGRLHFDDKTLEKGLVPIEKILDVVKDLKVARGKPKVFLIQSDDVSLTEKKVVTKAKPTGAEKLEIKEVKIPSDADRVIIQSTIPQCLMTGERKQSLLVQAFVETIKENQRASGEKQDFLSLTTTLNGKVSNMIERIPDHDKLKQELPVPSVTSTLTKYLNFHQHATV